MGVACGKLILNIYKLGISDALKGDIIAILATIIGATILFRLSKRYAWISNYGMAAMVGTGLGLAVRGDIDSKLIRQIIVTITDLANAVTVYDTMNAILGAVIVIAVVYYFTFSSTRTGYLLHVEKFARYIMMLAFGAMFGGSVMTRLNYYIATIEYIFRALGLMA